MYDGVGWKSEGKNSNSVQNVFSTIFCCMVFGLNELISVEYLVSGTCLVHVGEMLNE